MNKKNQWTVKMVNPQQIAQKGYRGCGTTQAVKNFCTRYGVNCFWWTPPTGGKKVFMVDVNNFRNCWKLVYGSGNAFGYANAHRTGTTKTKLTAWNTGRSTKGTKSQWTTRTKTQRTKYRRAA
jgi:hypothetical protein